MSITSEESMLSQRSVVNAGSTASSRAPLMSFAIRKSTELIVAHRLSRRPSKPWQYENHVQ